MDLPLEEILKLQKSIEKKQSSSSSKKKKVAAPVKVFAKRRGSGRSLAQVGLEAANVKAAPVKESVELLKAEVKRLKAALKRSRKGTPAHEETFLKHQKLTSQLDLLMKRGG